jgi:hypothetical protein
MDGVDGFWQHVPSTREVFVSPGVECCAGCKRQGTMFDDQQRAVRVCTECGLVAQQGCVFVDAFDTGDTSIARGVPCALTNAVLSGTRIASTDSKRKHGVLYDSAARMNQGLAEKYIDAGNVEIRLLCGQLGLSERVTQECVTCWVELNNAVHNKRMKLAPDAKDSLVPSKMHDKTATTAGIVYLCSIKLRSETVSIRSIANALGRKGHIISGYVDRVRERMPRLFALSVWDIAAAWINKFGGPRHMSLPQGHMDAALISADNLKKEDLALQMKQPRKPRKFMQEEKEAQHYAAALLYEACRLLRGHKRTVTQVAQQCHPWITRSRVAYVQRDLANRLLVIRERKLERVQEAQNRSS